MFYIYTETELILQTHLNIEMQDNYRMLGWNFFIFSSALPILQHKLDVK